MSERACAIGKDYRPASFKGAGFYCTDADAEGGRRGAEGEFPFGENTAYADLGRKIRVYHLVAAFRRDNHVFDSEAVFRACESPGPGILVHPTRGAFMAACRKCKVSDKIEDAAGETTAEMEFVEANIGFSGIAGLFGIISSGLNISSRNTFYADYAPTRVAQPWRNDVVHTAQLMVATTAEVATHTLVADSPATQWRTVLHMNAVASDVSLASLAVEVDDSLSDGSKIIATNITNADVKFNAFRRLANVASFSSKLSKDRAARSEEAVLGRQRILAAIGMAEAAMARKYSFLDQSLAAMDIVMAVFDDEAKAAYDDCNNDLFLEIRKYQTEFSKMMHDLAYRLPGLIQVDFAGGVHPLVAAYAIYNDAKRHRDLEPRNIVDANGRIGPVVTGVAPT